MCVRLGEWVYSSVPEASSWRESLASQSRREGETNKRKDDSELYRCTCVRAYVQTMPLIFAHHLRAVAQKEEQGFQVGGPADPGAVWVGGGGVDAGAAAAARGTLLTLIGKDGVADELRDEPAHDVRAHHPRQAGLEQLDAVVRREGATAGAVAASSSSFPCSQQKRQHRRQGVEQLRKKQKWNALLNTHTHSRTHTRKKEHVGNKMTLGLKNHQSVCAENQKEMGGGNIPTPSILSNRRASFSSTVMGVFCHLRRRCRAMCARR